MQLGVSTRTLERWIGESRIGTAEVRRKGLKPGVVVNPADILRVLEEQSVPSVRPSAVRPPEAMLNEGRAPVVSPGGFYGFPSGDELPRLLTQLVCAIAARPAPAPPKPWLSLDEAAGYSGLPRAWLLAQARNGSWLALNVGSAKRASWRFSRGGLRKLRAPDVV